MIDINKIFRKVEQSADFSGHIIDSVSYRNGYGDTPLHIVSNWGDCEAIKVLINAGCDINSIGESGFTALHCASEQNHPNAIKLLVSLGAKILQDNDGQTPLELAKLLGNKAAVDAFK